MKKKLSYLLIILILPLGLAISAFCIPSQYEKSYMGELKYKLERLRTTNGKRIIIVGGSGMAFDVDSSLIKENFPEYEVVNMGMYAALGSNAILNLTMSQIHNEDIVIFAPEQNEQTLSNYLGADYAWQSLDGAYDMIPYFFSSEDNSALMLAAFPRFAADKLQLFITDTAPDPTSVYRQSAFNEYGDIKDHLPENIMTDGFDKNTTIVYDRSIISDDFISYLNNCNRTITQNGALLLFAYCPANTSAVNDIIDYGNEDTLDLYHSYLKSQLEFDIIGDPHNSCLDPAWFYDTNYHLNSSGKILYTRQLIRDLKAYTCDTSLTDISVPDKPLYDPQRSQYEASEILTADTYSGDSDIDIITISENTTLIEDYSFNGCTSLKEIHIKNAVPSNIQIGQHLLDGTDANIFVPAESLSIYKTDYRFSMYSDRIFADN